MNKFVISLFSAVSILQEAAKLGCKTYIVSLDSSPLSHIEQSLQSQEYVMDISEVTSDLIISYHVGHLDGTQTVLPSRGVGPMQGSMLNVLLMHNS